MNKVNFNFKLLMKLVVKNPVKVITILVSILSYYYAGSFSPEVHTATVIGVPTVLKQNTKNTYIYISESISGSSITHSVLEFNDPIKIVNNTIEYTEYNGFNVFFWVIFGISLLIIISSLAIGMSDDDVSWEFDSCIEHTISRFIRCEIENEKYYYTIFNRLISVRDSLTNGRYRNDPLCKDFGIYRLSDLKSYPYFETKQNKRNNKLNKLGI